MGVELKLYETAELKVKQDLKPGHIVEAFPGSFATLEMQFSRKMMYLGDRSITQSPTNVFGYFRGLVASHGDDMMHPIGTGIVQMFYHPFAKPDFYNERDRLSSWGDERKGVYLVLGEVVRTEAPITARISSYTRLSQERDRLLGKDSFTLTQVEWDALHQLGIELANERGGKDYVFKSPGGQTFSLQEILLSLVEKPKDITPA